MKAIMIHFAGLSQGHRMFLIGLCAVVVLPFTLLIGLQLYNAATLAVIGTRIVADEATWQDEARAIAPHVTPQSISSPASRTAYALLSHHDEIVPERRVVVTIQEPLGTLKKNEARRDPETLLNEAASRVQAMGESECGLLVGTLASQCTVMSATGRPSGAQGYEYQFQLAFVERNGFGKTEPGKTYELAISRSSPGRAATNHRVYFDKSARQRQRIYSDVADTCARMRRKAGNCSVTGLSVAARLDRGSPMVRIAASATYASLLKADAELAQNR